MVGFEPMTLRIQDRRRTCINSKRMWYMYNCCFTTLLKCYYISGSKILAIIKLKKFVIRVRIRCGSGRLNLVVISPWFAIFKNVVHSSKPRETPSSSASHQAPNYLQRS